MLKFGRLQRLGLQMLRFKFSIHLPPSPPAQDCRSDEEKMAAARMRAKWASKFIQTIANAKLPNKITDPSLKDKLLAISIEDPHQGQELKSKIKEEMMAYFTEGVDLNSQIFNQNRIDAVKKNGLFRFSPSYLVTQYIFDFLEGNSEIQIVLHGNFGVGKTISFVMYAKLSAIIHEYIEACNNSKERTVLEALIQNKQIKVPKRLYYWNLGSLNEFSVQKSTAVHKFFQNNDINYQENKLIRYIQKADKQTKASFILQLPSRLQQKAQQLSISQIIQLIRADFVLKGKTESNGSEKLQQIKMVHKLQTTPFFIVDQINSLAAKYRIMNREYAGDAGESKQYYKNNSQLQSRFLTTEQKKYANYIRQHLYHLTLNRVMTCFNSSVNIEKRLMNKKYDKNTVATHQVKPSKSYQSMNLVDTHGGITYIKIPYVQRLSTDQGMLDFHHTVWHQIEAIFINQIKQNTEYQQKQQVQLMKEIVNYRNIFNEYYQQKKYSFYVRFLSVRNALLMLNSKSLLKRLLFQTAQASKATEFKRILGVITRKLSSEATNSIAGAATNNFTKTDISNIMPKLKMYEWLRSFSLNKLKQFKAQGLNPQAQEPFFTISEAIQEEKQLYHLFNQMRAADEIDEELLLFEHEQQEINSHGHGMTKQTGKFVFFLRLSDFKYIFESILNQCLFYLKIADQTLAQTCFYYSTRGGAQLGWFFEYIILELFFKINAKAVINRLDLQGCELRVIDKDLHLFKRNKNIKIVEKKEIVMQRTLEYQQIKTQIYNIFEAYFATDFMFPDKSFSQRTDNLKQKIRMQQYHQEIELMIARDFEKELKQQKQKKQKKQKQKKQKKQKEKEKKKKKEKQQEKQQEKKKQQEKEKSIKRQLLNHAIKIGKEFELYNDKRKEQEKLLINKKYTAQQIDQIKDNQNYGWLLQEYLNDIKGLIQKNEQFIDRYTALIKQSFMNELPAKNKKPFADMISYLKDHSDKQIIVIPVSKPKAMHYFFQAQKETAVFRVENAKAFDWMVLSYNNQSECLQIKTYDCALAKTKQQISDKLINASQNIRILDENIQTYIQLYKSQMNIQLLKSIKFSTNSNSHETRFNVVYNHTVLCRQNVAQAVHRYAALPKNATKLKKSQNAQKYSSFITLSLAPLQKMSFKTRKQTELIEELHNKLKQLLKKDKNNQEDLSQQQESQNSQEAIGEQKNKSKGSEPAAKKKSATSQEQNANNSPSGKSKSDS